MCPLQSESTTQQYNHVLPFFHHIDPFTFDIEV